MALAAAVKRFGLADVLVRRNPMLYARAARSIRALESESRRNWIDQRLAQTLRAAGRTEYGRSVGAPTVLAEWPILEKQRIRERPMDFMSGNAFLSIGASTSGTSGTPLQLRRSLASVAYEQAVIDRCLERVGVDPARCRGAVLRGDDLKSPADREPPYWRLANGGRRLLFSSNHLDRETLDDFVGALRDYAPDVLFAYPTVLDSLCALMAERGEKLKIPVTVCSSETLTRATCDAAATTLSTRILDYYGQAERVAFASGNPIEGYRFHAGYSVNELHLLEEDSEGAVYELVATGLSNELMPLVRYKTGDKVRLAKGADPLAVARGEAPFLGIIGRSDDVLISPSGARLTGIDHIPRGVHGVVRAQFIQESPTEVRLLIIPADNFDERSRSLLLDHAALKLPPQMQVTIELTTQLVRNASGKAPFVVRRF
jgi:phenylacetate-CoA ligase